jgi:hypothetical protein
MSSTERIAEELFENATEIYGTVERKYFLNEVALLPIDRYVYGFWLIQFLFKPKLSFGFTLKVQINHFNAL